MRKMTRVTLHRHLLRLLERPTTSLELGTVTGKYAGHVILDDDWPPSKVAIRIDANNQPLVQYVIHELLHVVFDPTVTPACDETLEEVIIVALDTYMYEYVKGSKARLAKWNALIERKLAATEKPAVSLEELVDRS